MTTLPDLSDHLPTKEGFCRPDWRAISAVIERDMSESEWAHAWESASLQWLDRLRHELAGPYRVHQTTNFLVLTEASDAIARDACSSYEAALKLILKTLAGVASDAGFGKHVVLMFAQMDDYYRYITFFYPDGEHPMSGGVCLGGDGYVHFAFPTLDYSCYRNVLVHELTHGCVAHLPLPTWLNEALAMRMEDVVCGSGAFVFDPEMYELHAAHWDSESIQAFWSGESWAIPGEGFELSYNLAQVLWRKIEVDLGASHDQVVGFITAAQASDAGEAAFRSTFRRSLSDLVQDFLGGGNWEPDPDRWVTDRSAQDPTTRPPLREAVGRRVPTPV